MTLLKALKTPLTSLLTLLYPDLCLACHQSPTVVNSMLCVSCQYHIKPSNYHLQTPNPVQERFWGRVAIEEACTGFIFVKGGALQQLIHQLKYQNQPQIGVELGQRCGELLLQNPAYKEIDAIVPVPLHPKKLRQRGYNQAALFAQGLADVLQKPCWEHGLKRARYTETQTKKSRLDRISNVAQAFVVNNKAQLTNHHILLVDDVITTGATLEACAQQLLTVEGVRVSIVAIALAN